ncbi:hypothetical protein BJY21_001211 [Kineosphaera limosa]|uniref:Elongation factor G-binding protein C-terminal treble-clef zinc-finger domain-containing protein n=1 Tax=Kineosphaera limosa NBRC 100340 TaxID=1184609 RepID=K6VHX6_9MICO|nr:FBP domain-containing protein [Kineosphaera limosa]NYE00027.1 hypothetical protein [Kineosphaera limosa]GAB95798.1 hypothetical protein KILIM_026_00690 [Kineosphaera limosa NBRC 100340]
MTPITPEAIRAGFVNASKREAAKATLPALDDIDFEHREYLGWRDPKLPETAYLALELDGELRVVLLHRAKEPAVRRKKMCVLCEDVVNTDDVSMYSAAFAGPAGRKGNTIGTFICTEFICSANVRRPPTFEAGGVDEEARRVIVTRRIDGLRERSANFVNQVLGG